IISPENEGTRVLIVELEQTTAPDPRALADAYSYVSRTTWSSDALNAYREQLSACCEILPGWDLRRSGHGIWETTSAYVAFAHALVVRCSIQDIPKIADLPFVVGIIDGESAVSILHNIPESRAPGSEPEENLLAWTEDVVNAEELRSQIAKQGWLPISQEILSSLVENPSSITALSNSYPTLPEVAGTLLGLSTDGLSPPDEESIESEEVWPYGLPLRDFGAADTLSRSGLLMCADASFHASASFVTLCSLDSDDSSQTIALLWKPTLLSGVAAVGAVEGASLVTQLPSSAFPVPEAIATMGSHPDRVVLEWDDLGGAGKFEVLRAPPMVQAFSSLGIAESTTFSDWDVETCLKYKYVVRVLSESGVGLESETSQGFVGEVPEIVDWIIATDVTTLTGGIEVEWAPAERAETYNLWRSEPVTTPYQSATKVYRLYRGSDTSFLDLDVVPGTTYQYCAVPYNGCGASAVGNPSNRATAMFAMPPEGNPKPPNWLTASLVTPADQVKLSWRAVSGVSEYRIYRSPSYHGPYEVVCTTSELKWNDTSALHCQDYWYRIQSVSGDEAGPLSAVAHGVCGGKPGPPSGLTASDGTYADAIRLDWGAGHEADYYHIFRSTSIDGPYTKIGATEEHFVIDVGLEPGQVFWYRVAARNGCGGSGYTVPVWGATVY
ncbi:fibronectin type III domain-containing protein, partial [Candidatus Bipolaricaulota bacterium]